MQYSLDNLTINMFMHLATYLKGVGWNVFWHATGETETHTSALPEALGTVSLIQDIPATPTFVVNTADGDYARQDHIVLPAFAVKVDPPRRGDRYGLGDPRYWREADIKIGGIVTDARQQATLASALYEWLLIGDENYMLSIADYDSDPSSPPALDPAEVWWANMTTPEVASEVDNIRYQIHIELILRYVE